MVTKNYSHESPANSGNPDAFLNQPVEIVLIPKQLSDHVEARRKQVHAFFDQFQADVSLLRFTREELYDW